MLGHHRHASETFSRLDPLWQNFLDPRMYMYLVSFVVLQKRELVALLHLPSCWHVVIGFCVSSSRCRGLVCSRWVWHFLVIPTYLIIVNGLEVLSFLWPFICFDSWFVLTALALKRKHGSEPSQKRPAHVFCSMIHGKVMINIPLLTFCSLEIPKLALQQTVKTSWNAAKRGISLGNSLFGKKNWSSEEEKIV